MIAQAYYWSCPGFFLLVNHEENKVMLFYSKDCAKRLVGLVAEFKAGTYEIPTLISDFIMNRINSVYIAPEPGMDKEDQAVHLVNVYKKQGYTFYKEYKIKPLKVVIDYQFLQEADHKALVHVFVLRGTKKTLVGLFKTKKEADYFIDRNYKDNTSKIIFCKNKLTKTYAKAGSL